MAIAIHGTNGVTYNDGTLQSSAPIGKNLIINGNMQIAQRGTSFSNADSYSVDRFLYAKNNDGQVTISQDTDVPTGKGFSNSLKINCTTADTSVGSTQFGILQQRIEGQNLQHLKFGTANAETLTLSFWVKSNKTGTYCIALQKLDTTRYDYVSEYTVSSSDTWENKIITIEPDSNIKVSGGSIANDNGIGFVVAFTLIDGADRQGTNNTWSSSAPITSTSNQVNFLDSTSNYINITGVQLEVGTTATDFEHLQYGQQLALCQRYYVKFGGDSAYTPYGTGNNYSTTNGSMVVNFPVSMRTTPTLTVTTPNRVLSGSVANSVTAMSLGNGGALSAYLDYTSTGLTVGYGSYITSNGSTAGTISFSSEL